MSNPARAHILICAATPPEALACAAASLGNKGDFEVLRTGMGSVAAETALRARLTAGPPPSWIVSSGFAGSLTDEIAIGTWVLANAVRGVAGTELEVSGNLPSLLSPSGLLWQSAACLSVPEVLHLASSARAPAPVIVDLESHALARVCAESAIPFDVLRIVSDTPSRPIPASITAKRREILKLALESPEISRFSLRIARLTASLAKGWRQIARASGRSESPIRSNRA